MNFRSLVLFSTLLLSVSAFALPEWTILHYGSGNNNLDSFIQMDVNQMEKVGSTSKIQVVSQLASYSAQKTKRYFIQKDAAQTITSPVVQDLGKVDMGDWKTLADFIIWGMKTYPAKRYFVIIGGHGNGWRQASVQETPARAIAPDDFSGNEISTIQLAKAFDLVYKTTGKQVDIFGADACLMASVEVATQISGSVKIMVTSEALEPGEGWVYDDLLKKMNRESDQSPRNIGRVAAKAYMTGYHGIKADSYLRFDLTMSAVDLGAIARFNKKFKELTQIIARSPKVIELHLAINAARNYYDAEDSFVDIGMLLDNILKVDLDVNTKNVIKDIKKEYESNLIIRDHASKSLDKSTGLTVWAPRDAYDIKEFMPAYNTLLFQTITKWGTLFNR